MAERVAQRVAHGLGSMEELIRRAGYQAAEQLAQEIIKGVSAGVTNGPAPVVTCWIAAPGMPCWAIDITMRSVAEADLPAEVRAGMVRQ
jgi:hypothetical protein